MAQERIKRVCVYVCVCKATEKMRPLFFILSLPSLIHWCFTGWCFSFPATFFLKNCIEELHFFSQNKECKKHVWACACVHTEPNDILRDQTAELIRSSLASGTFSFCFWRKLCPNETCLIQTKQLPGMLCVTSSWRVDLNLLEACHMQSALHRQINLA